MLGDGGVPSGDVGSYVSVGDALVPREGDMELCGDTVLSRAVSGTLCDLVMVSGGGDTDVSDHVGTVVSAAVSGCLCDLNRASRGDMVGGVDETSLSGGGGAVVSGVAESVCGVNSMMSAGVRDLCGVDTVLSDVDDSVCGGSSVMTVGELDVCG